LFDVFAEAYFSRFQGINFNSKFSSQYLKSSFEFLFLKFSFVLCRILQAGIADMMGAADRLDAF
jgi:hypothetical protein